MPGYTKHEYIKFMQETKTNLKKYVKAISVVLPEEYTFEDIVSAIEKYYPYEWRMINERYEQYAKADKTLAKFHKKHRYNMPNPRKILLDLSCTKSLLSENAQQHHKTFIKTVEGIKAIDDFSSTRLNKIAKRKCKIDKALERAQRVEPDFLDRLIGLYDRKSTTQKERIYIIHELEKYYCPKTISFFQRIAHSELNFQLRERAVQHLLSIGHYAKLRRQKYMRTHAGNKKRRDYLLHVYAKQKYSIKAIPQELEYRIQNSKEQQIKKFDYFISHSSLDYEMVQILIDRLNAKGMNVYCDWISDSDYLKRKLLCDATLDVIEKRIAQSNAVLLLDSTNSRNSKWVQYELNYAHDIEKPLFTIDIEEVNNGIEHITPLQGNWYINLDYKQTKLIPDRAGREE